MWSMGIREVPLHHECSDVEVGSKAAIFFFFSCDNSIHQRAVNWRVNVRSVGQYARHRTLVGGLTVPQYMPTCPAKWRVQLHAGWSERVRGRAGITLSCFACAGGVRQDSPRPGQQVSA